MNVVNKMEFEQSVDISIEEILNNPNRIKASGHIIRHADGREAVIGNIEWQTRNLPFVKDGWECSGAVLKGFDQSIRDIDSSSDEMSDLLEGMKVGIERPENILQTLDVASALLLALDEERLSSKDKEIAVSLLDRINNLVEKHIATTPDSLGYYKRAFESLASYIKYASTPYIDAVQEEFALRSYSDGYAENFCPNPSFVSAGFTSSEVGRVEQCVNPEHNNGATALTAILARGVQYIGRRIQAPSSQSAVDALVEERGRADDVYLGM